MYWCKRVLGSSQRIVGEIVLVFCSVLSSINITANNLVIYLISADKLAFVTLGDDERVSGNWQILGREQEAKLMIKYYFV